MQERLRNPAALRELKEETGYVGKVIMTSPAMCVEPGLTNVLTLIVVVDVDGSQTAKQHLEDGEFVQVILVSTDNLFQTIQDLSKENIVDAKVWTYAFSRHSLLQHK